MGWEHSAFACCLRRVLLDFNLSLAVPLIIACTRTLDLCWLVVGGCLGRPRYRNARGVWLHVVCPSGFSARLY